MNFTMVRLFCATMLLTGLLALGGCRERFEWKEKLTVTVETPTGEVSGSAVVRQVSLLGQMPLASNAVEYEIDGEATVVEVASGRFLFALLNGVEERAVKTFRPNGITDASEYFAAARDARGAKPLRGTKPMFVTFEDISDPKSVELVDPRNLAATFGTGFALKSITIEITDEKVSERKVESLLGWLCDYKALGARLNGSTSIGISDNEQTNRTGTGSFKRGECK